MGILKGAMYVAGALVVSAAGICAGWALNEKYSERSTPSTGGDSGNGGGGKAPYSPISPSSDTSAAPADSGLPDDDLDAIRDINIGPELAKIMREVASTVLQGDGTR